MNNQLEFSGSESFSISQIRHVLELSRDRMLQEKGEAGISLVFRKTLDYVNVFSKINNRQTVENIRSLFPDGEFDGFEATSLMNLACETSDEAKILIPSLSRIPDDHLQNILNEMNNLIKFQ